MSYEYQPKFPKAKLHEIVTKYFAVMLSLGKGPTAASPSPALMAK